MVMLTAFVLIGLLGSGAFWFTIRRITHGMGARLAENRALLEKHRVLSFLQQEIALSRKLADSPIIQEWAEQETDPRLKRQAMAEFESFRRHFRDRSCFVALDRSKHYYFNNAQGEFSGQEMRYLLDRANPDTAWYFSSLESLEDCGLNVDRSWQLGLTKVWVNAVIRNNGKKLGLAGTGVDLTDFLKQMVHSLDPGIETLLMDRQGAITAHRDQSIVLHNAQVRMEEASKITVLKMLKSTEDRSKLQASLDRLASGKSQVENLQLGLNALDQPSFQSVPRLVSVSYLPEIQWFNLVLVDPKAAIQSRIFAPLLLLFVLAFLASLGLISWALNRLILKPLASLTASTRAIQEGRYDSVLESGRSDEIGQLSQSFQEMAKTVQDYTQNLENLVQERTEALSLSHQKLAATNQQLVESLNYAQIIQNSILPGHELLAKVLGPHSVIWKPRDQVGGDFYSLHQGLRGVHLILGDCTGHGVAGAFMTMTAHAILQHVIGNMGMTDPAEILMEVDRQIRTLWHQPSFGSETEMGLDMAVCWMEPGSNQMTFSGARIPLIHQGEGQLQILTADRQSLGYRESIPQKPFSTHQVELRSNSRFFLLSDGFLDQIGGPKGLPLGTRRFHERLAELADIPMEQMGMHLAQSLQDYQGSYPQLDDITLVAFSPKSRP